MPPEVLNIASLGDLQLQLLYKLSSLGGKGMPACPDLPLERFCLVRPAQNYEQTEFGYYGQSDWGHEAPPALAVQVLSKLQVWT